METTRKTRRNTGRGCLCETHAVRLIDRRPILSRTKRHSRTETMSGMDEPGVLLPLKMATPGFMAADERRNEGETPGVAMLHDLSQRRRKISWTSRSFKLSDFFQSLSTVVVPETLITSFRQQLFGSSFHRQSELRVNRRMV